MSANTLAALGAGGATGFVAVTSVYVLASGNEPIQTGAAQLVVKVWAGGGGGANRATAGTVGAGGGGSYAKKTIAGPFSAGTIAFTIGAGGNHGAYGSGNDGTNGTGSSVTCSSPSISITTNGGAKGLVGGAAGGSVSATDAGGTGSGVPPGSGGDGKSNDTSQNGADGLVRFEWT